MRWMSSSINNHLSNTLQMTKKATNYLFLTSSATAHLIQLDVKSYFLISFICKIFIRYDFYFMNSFCVELQEAEASA